MLRDDSIPRSACSALLRLKDDRYSGVVRKENGCAGVEQSFANHWSIACTVALTYNVVTFVTLEALTQLASSVLNSSTLSCHALSRPMTMVSEFADDRSFDNRSRDSSFHDSRRGASGRSSGCF